MLGHAVVRRLVANRVPVRCMVRIRADWALSA